MIAQTVKERKKLIIVDDSNANLAVCKNILKPMHDVFTAPSVDRMFAILEHVIPDLILLDVEMPDISGYEAAAMLSKNDLYKDIPFIFLTGKNDSQSEVEGLNLGAYDYIHKPLFAPLLIRRIELHLSLIESKKKLEEQNASITELLELKTLEVSQRIAAEEKAHKASQAKGEFLSRMSHEIRTPLNAVIGMIGIALNTEDFNRIRHCLIRADNASKQLLGIINDILDMSKIEAEKFELSYSEFNLEKMLISITDIINTRAESKNQNFLVHLNHNVPLYIICDELSLSLVIINLLTNAVKFTPDSGKIILRVEKIKETGSDVTLRIEVSDSGIGISEEQQKKLFSSFEQADSSISQKFGGTGLGLAISKRIVELMGGNIWIESELGKGSKFIFKITVHKGKEQSYLDFDNKINKEDIRILLVDDSEEMRAYFLHFMSSFKLNCDVAANALEALELLENNVSKPYNIFFIDWKIPGMNGIDLTKRIKEITADKSVVNLISAIDWQSISKQATAAGVDHFLAKPLFPSTILDAINNCIRPDSKESETRTGFKKVESSFVFENCNILAAEDIEINREIMAVHLEKTGITIDFAENGADAVSLFEMYPGKYALILMDIHMPKMDGYEATKKIRSSSLENAGKIPIIAMTANVFREDIDKCLAAGMDNHIGKPIERENMMKLLKKYLEPYIKEEVYG